MSNEYTGPERRKPLTDKELEVVKDQLLESIYADIGKKGVKGGLWVVGAIVTALFAWLATKGHFSLDP